MPKKKLPVDPKSLAVLLIDMQESFVKRLRKRDIAVIIPNQKRVLRWCATFDLPLVVLVYDDFGLEKDIIPELRSEADKVPRCLTVKKRWDNGFFQTGLEAHLRSIGARHLLITGVNATGCVLKTAGAAIGLGFSLVVAENLVADATRTCFRGCNKSLDWYRPNAVFRKEAGRLRPVLNLSYPRQEKFVL
ncbi:MAG: isochorismatase family cysteine hydrolase [Candidatus Paceibacterota bacterium]|jgi:nicotinamidase-related amidase